MVNMTIQKEQGVPVDKKTDAQLLEAQKLYIDRLEAHVKHLEDELVKSRAIIEELHLEREAFLSLQEESEENSNDYFGKKLPQETK